MVYLNIEDDLAESGAHEPGLGDVPDDGRREAEEDDHEVGHGEVDDEVIGDRPHGPVPVDGDADEGVPDETHDEDTHVHEDEHPFEGGRRDVVLDPVHVLVVRQAVLVVARQVRGVRRVEQVKRDRVQVF